jgi:two-component system sensor histidine kinase RegB
MPERSQLIPNKNGLNLSWLIKLRWGSFAGQVATILGVYSVLEIRIPLLPLLLIVAFGSASNLAVALWFRKNKSEVREWHLASVMSLDIVLLTLLLFLTGGPENPFSFLYLVNIALAAVALQRQWTWMLVALAFFAMGLLPFTGYSPLPVEDLAEVERAAIYQRGMWVAFGVTAGFIGHFLWRITRALARRESELSAANRVTARQEQLASLATVAAGAAHELATPLSTIALVAKELERSVVDADNIDASLEDLRLIRNQVARCRLILDQMGGGLGRSSEQMVEETSLPNLIRDALIGVRDKPTVFVEVDDASRACDLALPARAVSQALRALITNAQDASADERRVLVQGQVTAERAKIRVVDTGRGMSEEVLSRVSEPFFTTKPPGRGMGLGLYLTRAVVESLGGSLGIESEAGQGTRVSVELPRTVDLEQIREYPQAETRA